MVIAIIIAAGLIVLFLYASVDIWTLRWIHQRLCVADYEGALARANRLLRSRPNSDTVRFMRGTVLLFAGRLDEAEQDFRTNLARAPALPKLQQAVTSGNLGHVLLEQGRYAEAMASFEAAAALNPDFASAYNGQAEVRLRQNQEPQRALELEERALELKQRDEASRSVDRHMLAYMLANRGWALALLGRIDEALASVEKSLAVDCSKSLPGLAGARWRAGMALIQAGRNERAIEQFRTAQQTDPRGLWGNLAAKALREHSVWG